MSPRLHLLFALLAAVLVVALFSRPVGPLPAPGSFFHPGEGFWNNAETNRSVGTVEIPVGYLNRPVEIYYNRRGVPHIFAENEYDLYFAQGYVTARDRLFQLELQVRSAGGRLAEWFGQPLVENDRRQRRHGMTYGAEKTLEQLQGDEVERMLEAYTDGINAWIESLHPRDYPLEYKILRAEPRQWTYLHSTLLLKYMTQMLAGRSYDLQTSNTLALMGEDFLEEYISPSRWTDPIIPPGQEWNFEAYQAERPNENFLPQWSSRIEPYPFEPKSGSNNWAVSGSRTASGYPILAGDPHLQMSLPSIWYEMQLNAPGIQVYGVGIPGTPSIIKGFNRDIAWINTNSGADVLDWYEIEFRDETRSEYLHEGEWTPVRERIEKIHVRGGETVVDTVLYTHHGPVRGLNEQMDDDKIDPNIDYAIRWIGHVPSDELRAYYKINRAESVDDAIESLRYFTAPAQNFALADRHGSIAMQVAGKLPVKWEGQGRKVGDGRDSRFDWQGWIPYEQNPASVNPERGFVSSANQKPVDENYPYYLGDHFAPFERGARLNDRLSELESVTVDQMRRLQIDNFSYHAAKALPLMLERLDTTRLNESELRLVDKLQDWHFDNSGALIAPSVFHEWWQQLFQTIWRDLMEAPEPMRLPRRDRTVEILLEENESPWYRIPGDSPDNSLPELITQTFRSTIEQMTRRFGEPGESWQWGYVNNTNLQHIGQFPGLGKRNLFTDGSGESLNAVRGSHGPSWRMIVEFGPELRAYGIYPGGQTGNPGSPRYTEFIETWRAGELYPLTLLESRPDEGDIEFPFLLRLD